VIFIQNKPILCNKRVLVDLEKKQMVNEKVEQKLFLIETDDNDLRFSCATK
jgi:hypothetical protein